MHSSGMIPFLKSIKFGWSKSNVVLTGKKNTESEKCQSDHAYQIKYNQLCAFWNKHDARQ
jgi:hypothetical protein